MINEEKVDEILLELGYPEHLTGTKALREALRIYRPGMEITRKLYPAVAAAMNSTPARVERAIRHATECAWDRQGYGTGVRYFGNTISPEKGRPCNLELIARLERLCREN